MNATSKNIVKRHHVEVSTRNIYIIVTIATHSSISQQPNAIQKSTNQNHTSISQIILKNINMTIVSNTSTSQQPKAIQNQLPKNYTYLPQI